MKLSILSTKQYSTWFTIKNIHWTTGLSTALTSSLATKNANSPLLLPSWYTNLQLKSWSPCAQSESGSLKRIWMLQLLLQWESTCRRCERDSYSFHILQVNALIKLIKRLMAIYGRKRRKRLWRKRRQLLRRIHFVTYKSPRYNRAKPIGLYAAYPNCSKVSGKISWVSYSINWNTNNLSHPLFSTLNSKILC